MTDEPDENKPPPVPIRKSFPKFNPGPPLPRPPGIKFGLYPLGREDVVMSVETFSTVLMLLDHGTAQDQLALADQLRHSYEAFFVE